MARRKQKAKERVKEKRKKSRSIRRKRSIKYYLLLVLVVLFVWLGYQIIKSDFFGLSKITYEGNKQLTKNDLNKIVGIKKGVNLFSVSSRKVADKLKENNWIKDVEIKKRYFSGEMVITITERVPMGLVVPKNDDENLFLVDDKGYIIEKVTDFGKYDLPTILDLDLQGKSVGGVISSSSFKNMTDCLESLDSFILNQIQEITIESVDTLRLYTGDGVEILFGRAEDLKKKNFVLLKILKSEDSGKIIFIDLRNVNNPVVKKLGENN